MRHCHFLKSTGDDPPPPPPPPCQGPQKMGSRAWSSACIRPLEAPRRQWLRDSGKWVGNGLEAVFVCGDVLQPPAPPPCHSPGQVGRQTAWRHLWSRPPVARPHVLPCTHVHGARRQQEPVAPRTVTRPKSKRCAGSSAPQTTATPHAATAVFATPAPR